MRAVANIIQERRLLEEVRWPKHIALPFVDKIAAHLRWTTLSSSISATPFKMTRTAFSCLTSCLEGTFDVNMDVLLRNFCPLTQLDKFI